jgi:hypothetical protein
VKIDKAISIQLRDGQRLSLSLKETKELYARLGEILAEGDRRGRRKRRSKKEATRNSGKRKYRTRSPRSTTSSSRVAMSLSDAKKQEVLAHLNKELSKTPRTLTNLLKGVSYSASQLPAIRSIVESQENIAAKAKGKRTLYLKKE